MSEQPTEPEVPPKLVALWERICSEPLPEFAAAIGGKITQYLLLVKRRLAVFCYELAKREWGGRFFLASRIACSLIGVSQVAISNWLRDFERHRLLLCINKGRFRAGCSWYVWVHHATVAARVPKLRVRRPKTVVTTTEE